MLEKQYTFPIVHQKLIVIFESGNLFDIFRKGKYYHIFLKLYAVFYNELNLANAGLLLSRLFPLFSDEIVELSCFK